MLNNTNIGFLQKATIYEINTRQFSAKGDFASVHQHLPRLAAMGVDILWFMPIHPIGIPNRKGSLGSYYCSRDFFDVNPEFGTKDDFRALVQEAHRLGLKVMLDWVANHAAWDNVWVQSNPDYFLKDENGGFVSPYDWTDVIQIDHRNPKAHEAMRSAMKYWVKEFDIDGFRADLAHLTPLDFWITARKECEEIKPGLFWLAETEDLSYYQAFDIFYAWAWMRDTEKFFKQQAPLSMLTGLLQQHRDSYPEHAFELYFTTNHDENTWNGDEYDKYGVCALALAVFSFFYPGSVPLIYGGQEIPNRKALHFFDKDEIKWNEPLQLVDFYTTLVQHRKNTKAGEELYMFPAVKKLLAFQRGTGERVLLVFLNLDQQEILSTQVELHAGSGTYLDIFSGAQVQLSRVLDLHLQPGGFLVLEKVA